MKCIGYDHKKGYHIFEAERHERTIDRVVHNMIKMLNNSYWMFPPKKIIIHFNGITFSMKKGMTAEQAKGIWENAYKTSIRRQSLREQKIERLVDSRITRIRLNVTGCKNNYAQTMKKYMSDYGGGNIPLFADRWGRLMQFEIEKTIRKTLTPQIVEKTIKQAQAGTDLDMKMSNTALATSSKILMGHWKYGDQLGKILGMNEAQLIKFRLNALDKEYKQTYIKGHFTVIRALKGRLKEYE